MTDPAHTSAVVVAAYVYATLAPRRSSWRWAPALLPGAVTLGLLGLPAWWLAVLVVAASGAGLWAYGRVQAGAPWLVSQGGTALALTGLAASGDPAVTVPTVAVALAVGAAGLAVAVEWGGAFVGRAITPFTSAMYDAEATAEGTVTVKGLPKGFPEGGKTIGRWERLLIFLFVLAGAPTAVGFLVTAKSILRFGEIKDRDHQREAEYILIGTLMSFGFALVVSYATRLAVTALVPDVLGTLAPGP